MIQKIFLLFTIMYCSSTAFAQLIVTADMTPQEYVEDVLVGGGITVSNVTFNGESGNIVNNQCGMFEGNDGMIDLCDGIILASGGVVGAMGPNDDSGFSEPVDNGISGDADLELLIPGFTINDLAILEFDFVPTGEELTFNYIFGSEEYLEFVGSSFNDVFGFFICGPGLSGPYSVPDNTLYPDGSTNLAILPGTTEGVTIDNVNDVNNSESYVNNGDGVDEEPFLTDDFYIQYDGVTVILGAVIPLVPGETYHMKFAIADAGDTVLDSGVFLEGGSFSSSPLIPDFVYTNVSVGSLVEISPNCDAGNFSVIRSACDLDSLWYHFDFGGDAIYGIDYEPLPYDTLMIENQVELIYPMYAIPDGFEEGEEIVEVYVYTSTTGEEGSFMFQDTMFISIIDNYTFPFDAPDVGVYCPSDSANINADGIAPGTPAFDYTWSQNGIVLGNESQLLVPVPPIQWDSAYYNISAIDGCSMVSEPDSVWIFNRITSHPTVEITMDGSYCRGIGYPLTANVHDGQEDFTYLWSDGATTSPNIVTPFDETEYSVVITDGCDRTAEATATVVMPDPVIVDIDLQDYICLDEVLQFNPTASGGKAPYHYLWSMSPLFGNLNYESSTGEGTVSSLTLIDPTDNTVAMTLEVRDYCQRQRDTLGIFDGTDQVIVYTDTIALLNCLIPNVISPNGDEFNNQFQAEELLAKEGTLFIYDRWGKLLSESSDYTWNADNNEDGTYFYVVLFKDGEQKKGSFTILR